MLLEIIPLLVEIIAMEKATKWFNRDFDVNFKDIKSCSYVFSCTRIYCKHSFNKSELSLTLTYVFYDILYGSYFLRITMHLYNTIEKNRASASF
jgi:hypothetical protein